MTSLILPKLIRVVLPSCTGLTFTIGGIPPYFIGTYTLFCRTLSPVFERGRTHRATPSHYNTLYNYTPILRKSQAQLSQKSEIITCLSLQNE